MVAVPSYLGEQRDTSGLEARLEPLLTTMPLVIDNHLLLVNSPLGFCFLVTLAYDRTFRICFILSMGIVDSVFAISGIFFRGILFKRRAAFFSKTVD